MSRKNKRSRSSGGGSNGGTGRQRQQAAELAARLMIDGGIRDFSVAKSKAAQRLGMVAGLPSNVEIEQALIEYQQMFRQEEHASELQAMRETAREAMAFFSSFKPRLTGGVLSGSAGRHGVIELHLFSDIPESVALFLDDQRVPYEMDEKRFKDGRGGHEFFPVYRFVADESSVEVAVFPENAIRQSPRSLVDGKPMRRADIDEVDQLLAAVPGSQEAPSLEPVIIP